MTHIPGKKCRMCGFNGLVELYNNIEYYCHKYGGLWNRELEAIEVVRGK